MEIETIFANLWLTQKYEDAVDKLYDLSADEDASIEDRKASDDLQEYLIGELMKYANWAQEAFAEGKLAEAREQLQNIPAPHQPELVSWWETYQPRIDLGLFFCLSSVDLQSGQRLGVVLTTSGQVQPQRFSATLFAVTWVGYRVAVTRTLQTRSPMRPIVLLCSDFISKNFLRNVCRESRIIDHQKYL